MNFRRLMSLIAMALLWTGSQIPLYLLGSVPYYVYADIGGEDRWIWFVIANLLALASVCPFVGSMSDLMGRRNIALFGATLIIIGTVIASTAHQMNVFIGMSFAFLLVFKLSHTYSLTIFQPVWPSKAQGRGSTSSLLWLSLLNSLQRVNVENMLQYSSSPSCPSVLPLYGLNLLPPIARGDTVAFSALSGLQ